MRNVRAGRRREKRTPVIAAILVLLIATVGAVAWLAVRVLSPHRDAEETVKKEPATFEKTEKETGEDATGTVPDGASLAAAVTAADISETDGNADEAAQADDQPGAEEEQENGNEFSEETPEAETEREILDFVDVFGQAYRTTILPDAPKTEYDKELFHHDGNLLTYEDERFTSRLGVDVSHHQGGIDWERVKAAGYEFAFLRIGYRGYGEAGTLNADKRFEENLAGAHAAGMDVGVYFFAQAVNEEEAREEAAYVLQLLDGSSLELPVVYDPESILDDEARTDHVTGEQFTRNTEAFCAAIADAGYAPMVYANMLWEAFQFDMDRIGHYPMWYADYEPYPQTPYRFRFWQYTNEARIDGIDGAADLNIELIEK